MARRSNFLSRGQDVYNPGGSILYSMASSYQTRRKAPSRPLKRSTRLLLSAFSLLLLLLAAGCGQVITKPTATVFIPTATPTVTRPPVTPTPVPTETPAPATPDPTATPTPEPTPIIHTLQAGDTLIGLAREYGVTVQAIQEANGITDPRGLLVGQQIIIPTDPEARLDAGDPTPEPTPPSADISPLTFWEQPDALWALGEVTLKGDEALEAVIMQVDLLDQRGGVIASAQTSIQQDMLAPGETAGFDLRFSPPPGPFSHYYVQIASAQPAHVSFFHRDLDLENIMAQEAGESVYILRGEVVNQGADTALAVKVSIILYDADGRVTAVRRVQTDPAALEPGETGFFSAELIPTHLPVADYHIQAEGRRLLPPHD